MNTTTTETEEEVKTAENVALEASAAEITETPEEITGEAATTPFVELQQAKNMFNPGSLFRFRQKMSKRLENPRFRAILSARENADRNFRELLAMPAERRRAILFRTQCEIMARFAERRRIERRQDNSNKPSLSINWGKFAYAF